MNRSAALAVALVALAGCLPKAKIHQRAVDEVYKGYDYLKVSDLERAEVAFNHALEFNNDFPEAWNGLGLIELTKGNNDGAKQHFERAIRINPDFAEGHNNLGRVFLLKGRLSAAEDEFTAALHVNPDMLDARYNLGVTLLRQGWEKPNKRKALWTRARTQYLHLLEGNPEHCVSHHDLGFMAYENGQFAEAERQYRTALDKCPDYMEALHGECVTLVQLKRCDEAITYCNECLRVSPSVPQCKQSLAGAKRCRVGDLDDLGGEIPQAQPEDAD
jgi:tetratricopeptide (TPR) repeat protein